MFTSMNSLNPQNKIMCRKNNEFVKWGAWKTERLSKRFKVTKVTNFWIRMQKPHWEAPPSHTHSLTSQAFLGLCSCLLFLLSFLLGNSVALCPTQILLLHKVMAQILPYCPTQILLLQKVVAQILQGLLCMQEPWVQSIPYNARPLDFYH